MTALSTTARPITTDTTTLSARKNNRVPHWQHGGGNAGALLTYKATSTTYSPVKSIKISVTGGSLRYEHLCVNAAGHEQRLAGKSLAWKLLERHWRCRLCKGYSSHSPFFPDSSHFVHVLAIGLAHHTAPTVQPIHPSPSSKNRRGFPFRERSMSAEVWCQISEQRTLWKSDSTSLGL